MTQQHTSDPQRGSATDAPFSAAAQPRGELAAEVQALSRLNDASSRLWHVTSLEDGLKAILEAALSLLAGHKGNVQLLGDDGMLRIAVHAGFDRDFLDFFQTVRPEDSASCGRALQTGERVVIEDAETDERYAPLREVARTAGYRAVQSTPIINRDGRPLGMISTHFREPHRPSAGSLRLFDLYVRQAADFIDRCRAEEQLRQSEQQLKSLSDIAPGTILWASTPSRGCSFVTQGWSEYTGMPTEHALGFGWAEWIHPDDRERVERAFADADERHEAVFMDHRLRRADGEFRWMLAAGRPRHDERGEYLGLVGSVIDVHERKLAENALRDSEAILAGQKEAFQAAMDGRPLEACLNALVRAAVGQYADARAAFYMVDTDKSRGLHHVTGMSEEYARQVDGFEIGPESLACGLVMHTRQPAITPDVEAEPLWVPWRWMAREHGYRGCWSFPVQTSGGPILGTFALYFAEPREPTPNDLNLVAALAHAAAIVISKYDEANDRERAERELKEANRRKDEFLAVLGHELRNPLAPLSTAADLLEHAEKRPDLLSTVRPMMRRQIDHLSRLVGDLLDASRISRGCAELQPTTIDLRRAVESAVEQSKPLIAARRHRLSVELGDAPLRANGDFQRLTQVFVNLLANAAKYSDPGAEITVHAVRDGDQACVRVTDGGFGIPAERVQEIFEMFSQVPEHRSLVGGGGLGIGLALCRQLVELHGGSIVAKSEGLGHGSVFTVRLPLIAVARGSADAPAEKPAAHSPRRRVLVVDDNVDAASTLRMALELQGHDARAVFGGAEALAAMAQRDAEVVLLDLGMPQMDGFEVARRIRQLPGGRGVLLVALTGWGQDQDRERTADAGFDEHLTKPVDAAQLSMLLALEAGAKAEPKRAGALGSATTTQSSERMVS